MKKKLLIVFLICCLMFSIVSPVFAYSLPEQYDVEIPPIPEGYDSYNYLMLYDNTSNDILTIFYKDCNIVFAPYYKNSSYYGIYITDVISSSSYVEAQYYLDSNSWEDSFWICPDNRLYDLSNMLQLGKEYIFYVGANAPFYLADVYNDTSTYEVFTPPPMTLEQVTVAQIRGVQQILPVLDGNLKILVPFGVGLLALLTGLVLLSRVLRRFQR